MLGDLANPKSNKPYVVSPANQGYFYAGAAVNMVDSRHNNGAVISYVDGHAGWMSKASLNGSVFAPSVSSTDSQPVLIGTVFMSTASLKTADVSGSEPFRAALRDAGFTYGLSSNAAASTFRTVDFTTTAGGLVVGDKSKMPTWLDATNTVPAAQMISAGREVVPLGANKDNVLYAMNLTVGTNAVSFTLAPAAGASGTKRVGFILSDYRYAESQPSAATMELTSIQYGSEPAIAINNGDGKLALVNVPVGGSTEAWWYAGAYAMALPIKTGKNITLTFTMTGTNAGLWGQALVFEK